MTDHPVSAEAREAAVERVINGLKHEFLVARMAVDGTRTFLLNAFEDYERQILTRAPLPASVDVVEAECARLLAAYLRKEIGRLMQQAEHWAENGKPLAVHHRIMKADSYFQILCLMERDPTKGWKLPFDEIRAELERPSIKPEGTYPPSKELYRYRDPAFVIAALTPATEAENDQG